NIEVREETTVMTTTSSMGDVIGGTERPTGAGVMEPPRAETPTPRLDGPRNDLPRGDTPGGD
ncbi:hypothetical protein BGW38_009807, partial [Lunasporangiospora selenospora]